MSEVDSAAMSLWGVILGVVKQLQKPQVRMREGLGTFKKLLHQFPQ